jgi:hypothetical protein
MKVGANGKDDMIVWKVEEVYEGEHAMSMERVMAMIHIEVAFPLVRLQGPRWRNSIQLADRFGFLLLGGGRWTMRVTSPKWICTISRED